MPTFKEDLTKLKRTRVPNRIMEVIHTKDLKSEMEDSELL